MLAISAFSLPAAHAQAPGTPVIPAGQTNPSSAQGTSAPTPDEIVIVAHPPRCTPQTDDPIDLIDTTPKPGDAGQRVIRPDWRSGKMGVYMDDYPVTGPTFWQRVGERLDQYRFRVPENDAPMCIGSKRGYPGGFAQLRRALDAEPLRGHMLRFTAFVATWKAAGVTFWLAAGRGKYVEGRKEVLGRNIVMGDNTDKQPISGTTRGWVPVSFTIGPVPCYATQVSYGLTLISGGDLWIYKASLDIDPEGIPKHQAEAQKCTKDTTF